MGKVSSKEKVENEVAEKEVKRREWRWVVGGVRMREKREGFDCG